MIQKLTLDSDIMGGHQEDIKKILEGRGDIKRTWGENCEEMGRKLEDMGRKCEGHRKDKGQGWRKD